MKIISICMLLVLTSCTAIEKNEASVKKIAHDAIDEVIDETKDESNQK